MGKKAFWSVSINGYSDPGARLQGCDNDGTNLAKYLEPKGFEVHRLREDQASGVRWESFWRRAVQETGPNDVTVLHYSGHGSNGPSGLPTDPGQCMVAQDMRPFYASRVGKILDEEYRGGTIFLLLDCCHSETGTRLVWGPQHPKSLPWEMLNTSQDPIPSVGEARQFNLTALARSPGNGIIEFAACQANDVTYDAEINGQVQGCATRAWIDAATELDRHDAGYTVGEFQRVVQTKLPNNDFPNRPQLWASEGQRDQLMWTTP